MHRSTSVIMNSLFIPTSSFLCMSTDCDAMDGSNGFFDKFSTRYHISVVLRKFWSIPIHRMVIIRASRLAHATPGRDYPG